MTYAFTITFAQYCTKISESLLLITVFNIIIRSWKNIIIKLRHVVSCCFCVCVLEPYFSYFCYWMVKEMEFLYSTSSRHWLLSWNVSYNWKNLAYVAFVIRTSTWCIAKNYCCLFYFRVICMLSTFVTASMNSFSIVSIICKAHVCNSFYYMYYIIAKQIITFTWKQKTVPL